MSLFDDQFDNMLEGGSFDDMTFSALVKKEQNKKDNDEDEKEIKEST